MIDFKVWWARRERRLYQICRAGCCCRDELFAYARRVAHDAYKQGRKDERESYFECMGRKETK